VTPANPVEVTRHMLALDHLDDLCRIDDQLRDLHRRMDDAVKASGTTVTELFGFGPVGAAIAVGYTRDVRRFASRDRFAAYNGTAPIEVSSGGRTIVAAWESSTQSRDPHRGDHADPTRALTRTCLLRTQARRGQNEKGSDASIEATDQRRALRAAHRRRECGLGRACGDD
jgi:Transposase IS116/IS110/IS902 family